MVGAFAVSAAHHPPVGRAVRRPLRAAHPAQRRRAARRAWSPSPTRRSTPSPRSWRSGCSPGIGEAAVFVGAATATQDMAPVAPAGRGGVVLQRRALQRAGARPGARASTSPTRTGTTSVWIVGRRGRASSPPLLGLGTPPTCRTPTHAAHVAAAPGRPRPRARPHARAHPLHRVRRLPRASTGRTSASRTPARCSSPTPGMVLAIRTLRRQAARPARLAARVHHRARRGRARRARRWRVWASVAAVWLAAGCARRSGCRCSTRPCSRPRSRTCPTTSAARRSAPSRSSSTCPRASARRCSGSWSRCRPSEARSPWRRWPPAPGSGPSTGSVAPTTRRRRRPRPDQPVKVGAAGTGAAGLAPVARSRLP